jgi:hypothetical protein
MDWQEETSEGQQNVVVVLVDSLSCFSGSIIGELSPSNVTPSTISTEAKGRT